MGFLRVFIKMIIRLVIRLKDNLLVFLFGGKGVFVIIYDIIRDGFYVN